MRISLINPNTTRSMTDKAVAVARSVCAPATEIVGYTSQSGPASIQGAADGDASLPGLYEAVERAAAQGSDGVIIACFDDTGLDQVRTMVDVPVVGIGEAAYRVAAMTAPKFSVVTTLAVSLPVLRDNIEIYGLAAMCANVRASGVPVLDLEADGAQADRRVAAEVQTALAEDGCRSVVLGCAGMADLANELADRYKVPVIEGVSASVKLIETFRSLNIAPLSMMNRHG